MCVGLVIEPPYLRTVTLGSPPVKKILAVLSLCVKTASMSVSWRRVYELLHEYKSRAASVERCFSIHPTAILLLFS
jgi:uncharacterized membrane protein